LHRYASVPIFDKFDYEQKLEEAIQRNYFENNYEHYLFKHNTKQTPELNSVEMAQLAKSASAQQPVTAAGGNIKKDGGVETGTLGKQIKQED
jgi:hypothetical protein